MQYTGGGGGDADDGGGGGKVGGGDPDDGGGGGKVGGGGGKVGEGGGDDDGGGGGGGGRLNAGHLKAVHWGGLDKNILHCSDDLCPRLPLKQFLLSSRACKSKQTGGSAVKKLLPKLKFRKFGSKHTLSDILPDNILSATFSCCKLVISPIVYGNSPTSLLLLTSKTVTFFSNPISLGKQECKPLFVIITSFRVFDMFPKLAGKHP